MKTRPNEKLKLLLFKRQISQRQLSFGTGIDESLISKLIKYGLGTGAAKRSVARFLGVEETEIFPQR